MACPNLCTAEKCAELEARISVLEQALELLKASFLAHTNQDIPEAHLLREEYCLKTECEEIDRKLRAHTGAMIPYAHEIDGEVKVNVDIIENRLRVNVQVDPIGGNGDLAYLPEYEPPEPPPTSVFVDVFSIDDSKAAIVVTVNGETDEDYINFPQPTLTNDLKFEAAAGASRLVSTVGLGEQTASDSVLLDLKPSFSLSGNETGEGYTIVLNVEGETDSVYIPIGEQIQTIFINGGSVDLQPVLDLIEEKHQIVSARLDVIGNALDYFNNQIDVVRDDVFGINQIVTVDISGNIESGKCTNEGTDENGEPTLVDPYYLAEATNSYSGKGFSALNQAIALIENKITAIHKDVCLAQVEPKLDIPLDEFLPANCDFGLPNRENYESDEFFFDAVRDVLSNYVIDTALETAFKALKFTPGGATSFVVSAGASLVFQYLIESTFKQQEIAYEDICTKLDNLEQQDVVSLVATDKAIPYISDKQLILHLVKLEDYPQRKSNTYWQAQIPAAKDNYVWEDNFENLIISKGNQYAELQFEENYHPVSGYFESEAAANTYFDKVLTLTNATEKNRVIPKHKTPKTNVAIRTVRPYRAFITQLNANGQSECLTKYVPPVDNE